MMNTIVPDLKDWGVPDSDVKFEAFGPATVSKPKKPKAKGEAAAPGIAVVFSRSGQTFTWTEDDGSLLDFGEANGIKMDSGCRAGSCGTCVVAIKEGEPGYLSEPDAEPDEGTCLACIAIPKGRMVLDS